MKMEVRITSIVGAEKLKAYASVCFEDKFLIKGIRIIDGSNGRFVSMPSRKSKNGSFYDICFPVTKEFRNEMNDMVLAAYNQKMEEM